VPLSAGTKLGPYEILEPIGAGGMGEVYRATGPRMGRDVALKISAERFSDRFSREVHAVAALNHPNICTLYDVGPNYLVMELIEGPTLADRIEQGAIPLEEALAIAVKIAAALEAAHEKGIVHRDLKPGNIKIKPDGTVKVLDFGLAKVAEAAAASSPEASPAISMAATQAGVILGTAAYMSPEQARGKPVDKRADIWAFGVVLYEMLTGQRLFKGDDLSETLASAIKEQPNLQPVPAKVHRNNASAVFGWVSSCDNSPLSQMKWRFRRRRKQKSLPAPSSLPRPNRHIQIPIPDINEPHRHTPLRVERNHSRSIHQRQHPPSRQCHRIDRPAQRARPN
jgi:serine/threonine-protein kinase